MVLELCEQTMKDWIVQIGKHKLNDEDEDNMINFVSHISKGVAHLHANEARLWCYMICKLDDGM